MSLFGDIFGAVVKRSWWARPDPDGPRDEDGDYYPQPPQWWPQWAVRWYWACWSGGWTRGWSRRRGGRWHERG